MVFVRESYEAELCAVKRVEVGWVGGREQYVRESKVGGGRRKVGGGRGQLYGRNVRVWCVWCGRGGEE